MWMIMAKRWLYGIYNALSVQEELITIVFGCPTSADAYWRRFNEMEDDT